MDSKNNPNKWNQLITATHDCFISVRILPVMVVLLTSGCSHFEDFDFFKKESKPAESPVLVEVETKDRLVEVALSISSSLKRLSEIESSLNPIVTPEAEGLIPNNLSKQVQIDYVGPIKGIVHKLTEMAGYKLFVKGKTPVTPAIVRITSNNKTIIELLKDVGYQAGSKALVKVDARRTLVEITYAE